MNLFQKIRSLFGMNTEVSQSNIDLLDETIANRANISDQIQKAQQEFDVLSESFELRIRACNSFIEKGSTDSEFNKSVLSDRLDRLTNKFIDTIKDLTNQDKALNEKQIELEKDILSKSIEITALVSDNERQAIESIIKGWRETGLIAGVEVDHEVKAISKAIELALEEDEIEKAYNEITSKGSQKVIKIPVKPESLEGHYANVIVKRDQKILFLKRANDKNIAPGQYCLPGGHIDAGETIEQAASRELKEEANLNCPANELYIRGKAKCGDGKWAFYLSGSAEGEVMLLDGESSNAVWMCQEEWLAADLFFDLKDHLSALEITYTDIDDIPEIKKGNDDDFLHSTDQLVSHAENTSTEQLKKIIKNAEKAIHLRDAAKREIERRELEKNKSKKIKKSEDDNLIEDDFKKKDETEKAGKHHEYVKVVRDGKVFYQFREVGTDKLEDEIEVGDHVDANELDLTITKYSEKSLLITGNTYKNLELLRKIKADVGLGSWNKTLNGWIFPINGKEKIMSALIPTMPEATFGETIAKEQAEKLKNSIDVGATITVDGVEKTVDAVTVVGGDVEYTVPGDLAIIEKAVGIVPTDDPDSVIEGATEENRFKAGKELFGKEEGELPVSDAIEKSGQESFEVPINEFTTRSGEKIKALDYTALRQKDIQLVDQDGILDKPKPNWCSDINLQIFAGMKYDDFLFDYVKLDDDHFLLATNGYEKSVYGSKVSSHKINNEQLRQDLLDNKYSFLELERPTNAWGNPTDGYTLELAGNKYYYSPDNREQYKSDSYALFNNHKAEYAVVSIDQIVAMQDYYQKTAKALIEKKKRDETKKVLARVAAWDEHKMKAYYPFSYEKRLSDKQRKKYTKEEWESLPTEAKLAEIPNMKYPAVQLPTGKRISQLDEYTMKGSNFEMYKKYVDKSYKTPHDLGTRTYHLDDCVLEYKEVRDQLQWRKADLAVQREENDASYDKAFQTSYGDVNLKNDLLESHGVKIKLQNGKDVKADHVEQLKESLNEVYSSFGNRSDIAKDFGLKISHSGDKLMFASKALGMYVPSMKAIGVSNNKVHDKFGFTLAHEFAHFIDNYIGSKGDRHYASDNLNSTAGKIANVFRQNLNKKTDSQYLNRTCECFARAMEQYHAVNVAGEDAVKSKITMTSYHQSDEHVSKEVFNNKIKPLIQQFLKENESLIKALGNDIIIA